MSADFFEDRATGRTPDTAFRKAVKQALYDCGHQGYTGTIAEKDAFLVVPAFATPLPATATAEEVQAREAFAQACEEDDDSPYMEKWGPCGCIPLKRHKGGAVEYLFFGLAST